MRGHIHLVLCMYYLSKLCNFVFILMHIFLSCLWCTRLRPTMETADYLWKIIFIKCRLTIVSCLLIRWKWSCLKCAFQNLEKRALSNQSWALSREVAIKIFWRFPLILHIFLCKFYALVTETVSFRWVWTRKPHKYDHELVSIV